MYIDKELALRYVGGIEIIYHNLCKSFLKSYADYEKRVREALCDENELFELVHSLKGISLNLGAQKLYDCIKTNRFSNLEEFLDIFRKTYEEINNME